MTTYPITLTGPPEEASAWTSDTPLPPATEQQPDPPIAPAKKPAQRAKQARVECGYCGKDFGANNIGRHRKRCRKAHTPWEAEPAEPKKPSPQSAVAKQEALAQAAALLWPKGIPVGEISNFITWVEITKAVV